MEERMAENTRKFNFYAGPATLPLEVLRQIREEIVDFQGMGMSLIETSHRSKDYDGVHNSAIGLFRELLGLPENYSVLLLGGGATLQFSMVPMNLMGPGGSCDFVVSGSWAQKAFDDAAKIGAVNVLFDGKESAYTMLPPAESVGPSPGSSYVHITSNETIGGIQWKEWPDTGDVPLVADMSSDILSTPFPVERFGLIYAGAQKNLGPAGVAVVIIRNDLLDRSGDDLTAYLSYKVHAEKNSLYNTPPVFSIWALQLVLQNLKENGGVEAAARRNREKADLVYSAIDSSGGFYCSPVDRKVGSDMNVVFRLPSEELEKQFVAAAAEEGMVGLKGHRSVGGIRASIYNSFPKEGVEKLADFMKTFQNKNS
jgi:phosphoserine aminotransferase